MADMERWTSQQYQDYLKEERMKKEQRQAEVEQEAEQRKYKKEFGRKETKTEKEFRRPEVFESTQEADEYLRSLPPKERYEEESKLKGFRSGEERRRVIEQVNKEMVQRADIEKAKRMYGTPLEKYEEIRGKAEGVYETLKETAVGTKKLGRQVIGLESRADIAPRLKKGFTEAGKYVVGSAALALTPRAPSDIRNLEKVRKQIEKEEAIERKKIIEEKHQKKLEEIAAAGGVLTPSQRLSLERLKLKYRYGGRKRTISRPRTSGKFLSGFGNLGGFSLGGRPQRPTQKIISRQPERQVVRQTQIVNNPFGLSESGIATQRPTVRQPVSVRPAERRIVRTERIPERRVEYRPQPQSYNPVNNPQATNILFGGMNAGSSPVEKKKNTASNDPTGAGAYW